VYCLIRLLFGICAQGALEFPLRRDRGTAFTDAGDQLKRKSGVVPLQGGTAVQGFSLKSEKQIIAGKLMRQYS